MNWGCIVFSIGSIVCSIIAALVDFEIMPPMSAVDLTFGQLIIMALMFFWLATDSRRGEDGDQEES